MGAAAHASALGRPGSRAGGASPGEPPRERALQRLRPTECAATPLPFGPAGRRGRGGDEALRWQSSAFALDFYAAEIRYFYDGRCTWCGPRYGPGQKWNSVGAWYEPEPWRNSGQRAYIRQVQHDLATRVWT